MEEYLNGVSVCVFSFNYINYIAQTLDSILEQETSFEYEIIIGDDFSTDGTREIIKEYANLYPKKIKLFLNEKNLGGTSNWINTINKCGSKYIALIDGDDYFIDKYKLQKQYDLLESNSKANLCFHSVRETYEDFLEGNKDVIFQKDFYSTKEILLQGWFIRTGSLFFRNGILPAEPPKWIYDYPYRYDTIIIVMLSLNSFAINMKEVMTVWRRHKAGLSYAITKDYLANYFKEKALYNQLDEYTSFQHTRQIRTYIRNLATGVVLSSITSLSFKNFKVLGFRETVDINYINFLKRFGDTFRIKFNSLFFKAFKA